MTTCTILEIVLWLLIRGVWFWLGWVVHNAWVVRRNERRHSAQVSSALRRFNERTERMKVENGAD